MRKKIALTAIAAIIIALAALVWTHENSDLPQATSESTQALKPHDTVIDQLGLSAAQQARRAKIVANTTPTIQKYAEELRILKLQMDALSTDEHYDTKTIKTLAAEQAQIMAEIIVIRTQTQHAIYNLLTPQQKALLTKIQNGMLQKAPH